MPKPNQKTKLVLPFVDRIEHVIVVVPARNEHQRIEQTLRSIRTSASQVADRVSCSIVVVADCCTDSTAARAKLQLANSSHIVVEASIGTAGGARRVGARVGLACDRHRINQTWIASTDADTVVPKNWLTRHLAAAESGLDAIAGIVSLADDEDLDERLKARFDSYYKINADGTHSHVHGANMGVRANAYASVGGWPAIATGEDHYLWSKLCGDGWRVGSSAKLTVTTSARREARAPAGFAADMVALDESRGAA